MNKPIKVRKSSGDVFKDLGFSDAEATEAKAKSELISAIDSTMRRRRLTQVEAARLCKTDQPTLSKVLRGRMESVSIGQLARWLAALGRTVEIRIGPRVSKAGGKIVVAAV